MAVPHVSVKATVLEPEAEFSADGASSGKRGLRDVFVGLALLIVLGGGGFFAWKHFLAAAPLPAPRANPPTAAKSPAPAAQPALTPSEALNKLAHLPANAINKAQEALAARRASGQTRVDAASAGEDGSTRSFGPAPAAPLTSAPASTRTATAQKSLAPGLSATTQVEAAADASPEFRTFVANVKVSGVFQGSPSRAMINSRLTRVGETVDPRLGVIFDGVDGQNRTLVFKDRSGATVARKY